MSLSSRVAAWLSQRTPAGQRSEAPADAVATHLLDLHARQARRLTHDLKNDLQVLSGSLELLGLLIERGADASEMRALVSQADAAVADARTRLDAAATAINDDASSVDLNASIGRVFSTADTDDLLHLDLHPVALWVDVHPAYLHLLMHTLRCAAAKAMAKQGNVLVSSGLSPTDHPYHPSHCCVTVSADCILSDPGIPATLSSLYAMQLTVSHTRGVGSSIELTFPLCTPAGASVSRREPV